MCVHSLTKHSTEVGAIANVMPGTFVSATVRKTSYSVIPTAKPGMDYAYFTISPWVEVTFIEAGGGTSELVVLVSAVRGFQTSRCSPLAPVTAGVPVSGCEYEDR